MCSALRMLHVLVHHLLVLQPLTKPLAPLVGSWTSCDAFLNQRPCGSWPPSQSFQYTTYWFINLLRSPPLGTCWFINLLKNPLESIRCWLETFFSAFVPSTAYWFINLLQSFHPIACWFVNLLAHVSYSLSHRMLRVPPLVGPKTSFSPSVPPTT